MKYNNALFVLRENNSSKKKNTFLSIPPLPYLFHPSYLPSVIQYFSPFLSLPFSHFSTPIPHVFNCLSFFTLVAHSAPSFLFFHPMSVFSLSSFPHLHLAITFLSCALSLPRYYGISSVVYLSYFLLYLDSLILSLLFCLSGSLSLSLSSTFTHLPFAFNLSTSSLAYPFLR
jgi:hypothetical protein